MKIEHALFLVAATLAAFVLGIWAGQSNIEDAAVRRGHAEYRNGEFAWRDNL